MSTETPSPTPQSCQGILSDALHQLSTREARLAKLGEELNATRTAIKGLRKLIKSLTPVQHHTSVVSMRVGPARPAPKAKANGKPGDVTVAVMGVLRSSLDPLSVQQIAERLNRSGRGLGIVLSSAVRRGELVMVGESYGLPTPGASAEDLAAANGAG